MIFVRPVEATHPGGWGGGVLGLIFAGYVPLACLAVLFVHSQVKKGNPDSHSLFTIIRAVAATHLP